ncbi:hypothetical protein WN71_013500 [Streptomyces mangrovisoli]|uniref:Uncharacterized protein n=2 Tax=Streptomyces mangrovisoli TaxID=1428628 RepID=A0A1J4NXY5_9ACTN|nr:hypothetical protein WN71_013500 [Streptomyces mangrovisoli]
MALASSALTALIPIAVLGSLAVSSFSDVDAADRIIGRYNLTGAGAEAVRSAFSPTGENSAGVGFFGAIFLIISSLSFARASQRLFEQTWELKPLSVRNTRYGLLWILSVGVYMALSGWIYGFLGWGKFGLVAAIVEVPVSVAFLVWSGWALSAKRIPWPDLLPFGISAAVLAAAYSVGTTVYLPHLFDSYAGRYGSIGAVFAMISALFGAMLVIVGSSALGREVLDELVRIRRGERPSQDEVRRQWENVMEQTRSRWRSARKQMSQRRGKDSDED